MLKMVHKRLILNFIKKKVQNIYIEIIVLKPSLEKQRKQKVSYGAFYKITVKVIPNPKILMLHKYQLSYKINT